MADKGKYIDVTNEWLKHKENYGHISNAKMVTINDKKYKVNKTNKINHKNNEIKIAILTVETFGGELKFLPDIGEDENIRCGDFLYKDEIWDVKELGINAKSKKRAIDNLLKSSKGQANNFIIDITMCRLSKRNILMQIKKIYITKKRAWIDKIIIFKKEKLIKVYQRNKRD